MIGINEELKTIEAAMAVLSPNPNSDATIKVLRQAKCGAGNDNLAKR
jgi:hypothetical protein